jgi:hypothetical protein
MLNDCGAGGIRKYIVNHERLCRYHSPGYARLRVTAVDHRPNIRAEAVVCVLSVLIRNDTNVMVQGGL